MHLKVSSGSFKQWHPLLSRHHNSFILSRRSVFEHQNAEPWAYDESMPSNMRSTVNRLAIDYDGFAGSWKKRWLKFDDKSKRNEHHAKDMLIKKANSTLLKDYSYLDEKKQRRSKSNLRKMKKTKIKEAKVEDISTEDATKYLDLLQKIRDGVKSPKFREVQKHLPETVINKKKLERFIKEIEALDIVNINDIVKKSKLPSKQKIDDQCNKLNAIYDKITAKNEAKNNCLFHLDLYTLMLLSYGKIGRIHKMMEIYKELKTKNLQISNSTMITMLHFVSGHEALIKQIWNEYLNDFRKGKISERPSLELFNALMVSHHGLGFHGNMVYEVHTLFKMMTEEFKISPNSESALSLLNSYRQTSPPRYKSAQKFIAKMRDEFNLSVEGKHYAVMLSIIATKWGHFNRAYFDLEDVNEQFLSRYKDGIDLHRCMKVFDIVIKNNALKLESGLLTAIIKACRDAKNMSFKERNHFADEIIDKYVLLNGLNERFEEFSQLEIESNVCSQLIELKRGYNDFEKIKACFEMFCTNEKVKDRFVIDCDLFVRLIEVVTCGLKHFEDDSDERRMVAMARIEWIEAQMDKYDILPNTKVWYTWLMLAKRLKIEQFTNDLLVKMDYFIDNTKYFEFTLNLLQSVIEALFWNKQMDKALAYYSKYYTQIKLFSHWDLKSTGQREIDFHGFRAGFACVALQWILENEYPPLNISKYLLQMYGDKNPNISLVIGQGHHNQAGVSRLFQAISAHVETLRPEIQISRYPNNPGQVILNGDDVVRWRKHNGHQIDTVKVNENLQFQKFVDFI